MSRPTSSVLPDGGSVAVTYYPTGERKQTSGTRTYPVGYSYDSQGRMKTMTNWTGLASGSGARVTTWNYSTNRGFLTSKSYADGNGPSYTYTGAGRLKTRVWVRGIATTYTTNALGDVARITYSDTTPAVTNNLDRLGRATNVIDGAGSHFFVLHDSGLVLIETNSSGTLAGLSITNGYPFPIFLVVVLASLSPSPRCSDL
jgi:YD repeat-containing protein